MTAATGPTHPRLVEIAAFLDATRKEVAEAARAIPPGRWADRRAPAEWSPAEVLDHLRIVEHGIVRLVQKLTAEARASGHPAEAETASVLDAGFVARTSDRSRRIEAPPRVVPTRAPDLEGGLAAMATERAALLAAIAAADGMALGSLRWPHPALGSLDLYQWLVFVGAHERRHAAQLHELLEPPLPGERPD